MAQLYKKTGTCRRPSGAQIAYPMYLWVGESNDAPLCFSPALWLDASDADSITIVSDKVTQWADKSGNARHAVQATADSQPVVGSAVIDGKNTIRFDGSDDYLTVSSFPTGASAYSMYAVLKIDNDPPAKAAQSGFLTFDGDASVDGLYPYTDGVVHMDFATTARKRVGDPSPSLTSAHLLNFDSAASLWTCRINGTQIYTTGTNTVGMSSATNEIGRSGNYFDGDFAEILIFPSVLSAQNRLIVEGYLAHKWGLESSLPTGHPYKTVAPTMVSCDAHCKTDFGDIRFHDAADAALNYMIDWGTMAGTTPNQSVGVWVAPSPGTESTEVVMKYGDPDLADGSCAGTDIFIKHKNFESGSVGDSIADADADWTVDGGTFEIDTAQKYGGTRSAKMVGRATGANGTLPLTGADNTYAIRMRFRKTTGAGNTHPLIHGNGTKRIVVWCDTYENIYYSDSDGTATDTGVNCAVDTWELFEFCNIDFTAGTYDIWFNGVCIKSGAEMNTADTYPDVIRIYNATTPAGNDAWVDDLIVRKYASPEPTWGAWGAEVEIGSTPTGPSGIKALGPTASASIKAYGPTAWGSVKALA